MERYQRGKVYRIVCRKTGKQYIGSTCKKLLSQRLACHVCDFKAWKENRFHFLTSFTILEENDYYIELIELVPCSSNDELKVRERFHIQNNNCENKQLPSRTQKEWYEDNKEKIAKQMKEYTQINKEEIAEYKKKYAQINKEEISEYQKEYRQTHKEEITKKKKEHYEANKEEILEKKKEHYEANKEQLAEKAKEKYNCPCGSTICKHHKIRHEKTIIHKNYLKNQLENAEKIIRKNIVIENEDL